MSYPRIRDLEGCVGPITPGVALYAFDTFGGLEPDRLYNHSVLAMNEEDAADELLRHYFSRSPWVSYRLRTVAHWDGEKWTHFNAKGKKVTNDRTPQWPSLGQRSAAA